MTEAKYGHLEHSPIRWEGTEVWLFSRADGEWSRIHPAEFWHNGAVLNKEEFNEWFANRDLPPLPSEAFQKHD
jgi:hypothetical protein